MCCLRRPAHLCRNFITFSYLRILIGGHQVVLLCSHGISWANGTTLGNIVGNPMRGVDAAGYLGYHAGHIQIGYFLDNVCEDKPPQCSRPF